MLWKYNELRFFDHKIKILANLEKLFQGRASLLMTDANVIKRNLIISKETLPNENENNDIKEKRFVKKKKSSCHEC